jgi:two-component system NtrC family response regulator
VAAFLSFFSKQESFYKPPDAVIARRIASHVAMLMSHQRLADENRRAAALQERAANLEMLDGLLNTLAGSLDIREVFEQISVIARKVLPHDLLSLPMVTEDRKHITVHAIGGGTIQLPDHEIVLSEHHIKLLESNWDHQITPDLQLETLERGTPPFEAGYRGRMTVPIRLQGQLVGALDMFSFTPNAYSTADVIVLRRIADHIALALSHQRLAEQAQRAAEARERASLLERRVDVLTAEVQALGGHRRVIGESKAWKDVLKQATQVAATETTVLLLGDSGTGKEVVARFIHRGSARSGGPFVALNCAALPEQLLESELFGYERGAFTGALNAKPGQIEQAAGGVLFLDEVSEMSLSAQAKFLRVLQEREFQRLGGTRVMKANVRVIAATNRDLTAAIERGTFREDLYYRLHVFEIALPRLRDRPDDILPLSEAFLDDIARGFGRPPGGISREARRLLVDYHWPGNVRQLRNTLERAAILCEGGLITGEHLSLPGAKPTPAHPASPTHPASPGHPAPSAPPAPDGGGDLKSLERAAIEKALRDAKHNKSKAAKLLGLTRTQLYVRLRKYGLES